MLNVVWCLSGGRSEDARLKGQQRDIAVMTDYRYENDMDTSALWTKGAVCLPVCGSDAVNIVLSAADGMS